MLFAEPRRREFRRPPDRRTWRILLYVAAGFAVLSALQPWIRVHYIRLIGEMFGPPGWQSTPGFTLLCTSALLCVITMSETASARVTQAARPASAMLAGVMSLTLVLHVLQGPGRIRDVPATWTQSFYVGVTAGLLLLAVCLVRAHLGGTAHRPRPRPRGEAA